jgi:hypothetical protein
MKKLIFMLGFMILTGLIISNSTVLTRNNLLLSSEEIAELSTRGCPKSADLNSRFENLYKKFGEGKAVPYKFCAGDPINWNKIYYNIDFIIEEENCLR